jgi:hypothetical protein
MGIDYRNKEKAQLVEWVDNFDGKLLIIAHLLAPITPVTMALRLVDALQKANKRFDMLMLPGAGHALINDEYAVQRCWDYLVEHLLGLEPPKEFEFTDAE